MTHLKRGKLGCKDAIKTYQVQKLLNESVGIIMTIKVLLRVRLLNILARMSLTDSASIKRHYFICKTVPHL